MITFSSLYIICVIPVTRKQLSGVTCIRSWIMTHLQSINRSIDRRHPGKTHTPTRHSRHVVNMSWHFKSGDKAWSVGGSFPSSALNLYECCEGSHRSVMRRAPMKRGEKWVWKQYWVQCSFSMGPCSLEQSYQLTWFDSSSLYGCDGSYIRVWDIVGVRIRVE
jgi:hypothetical protein